MRLRVLRLRVLIIATILLFGWGFNTFDWFLNTNKKAWEDTELLPGLFIVSWFLYITALFSVFLSGILLGYVWKSVGELEKNASHKNTA